MSLALMKNTKDTTPKSLADVITSIRASRNLSQRKFAEIAGLPYATISHLESNRQGISAEALARMSPMLIESEKQELYEAVIRYVNKPYFDAIFGQGKK